ncbi:MAG TPA: SDR family NAD(P)-dependent oxidoreductase [Solirubrobacterales bacterium]|jgi:NAD(P)-dependent dehydrogenase (short-subunit alcohol dehydrogenase family)
MLDTGLAGRLCLVTGAASGIGRATAEILAGEGAKLALWDLDAAGLETVPTTGAPSVERSVVDVADTAAVATAVAALPSPVAAVVHCAGIYTTSPLPEVDEEGWDRVLSVNLKGAFNVSQAVAPGMTEAGGGAIVLFGSFAARTGGLRASAPYASSKAGVAGLTKHLAQWGGPHGIRVNCIHPGFIQTPMNAILSDQAKADAVAATPLRRLADPPECAAMAVVLASSLASFVHGVELDVNGGMYMA